MKAVVFLAVMCLAVSTATNPGFKGRITQKGLTYANKMAIQALSKEIRKYKIPDQSGKSGKIQYKIYEMQIKSFTTPQSSMLLSSSGMKWSARGAGLKMHGKFHYKFKKGWIHVSDHGSFDATLDDLSFSITMKLTRDSSGKPKLVGSGCSCDIRKVSVKFHGGASFIYNLFRKVIGGKVKDLLKKKMCGLVTNAINTDANRQLAKLPMNVVVAKKFMLDYSLTGNPTFNTKYMETFHKGEVYWKGGKESYPSPPAPLPTSTDTSRMLYLWVSEYMGNTLGYAGFHHGYLQHNLTAKDLPPANRSLLNTTCTGFKCIGVLIPQIGKKYPHATVMFHMYATAVPVIKISKGIISMNFTGNVDMYAQLKGGKRPFLLTITCNFLTNVTAGIQGQLLKGKITGNKLTAKVKNSKVGPVPSFAIQFIMNAAIDGFVIPTLNAQGQKGLVLPVTGNIKFSNAKLSLLEGAVLIATDLTYKPSVDADSDTVDEDQFQTNVIQQQEADLPDSYSNMGMSFNEIGQKNDIFDRI